MSTTDLRVIITAKDRITSPLNKIKKNFGSFKLALLGAGAAVGILGLKLTRFAITSAADFQLSMAKIETLILGNEEAVKKLSKGIKELIKTSPESAEELGAAAYQILSAGITDTDKALNVLAESMKLGAAGLGSTSEAVNLMSGALNAFKTQNISAEKASDIFFKTVKAGKTTVAELSQGFGQVAPIAATLGVELTELQAATAALTTANIPTTVAQTQLRSAMVALIKPTKEMKGLLGKIGVTSGITAIEQFGLVGTMDLMTEAAGGNVTVLAEAFGRVEGLNAALALTGDQAKTFTQILENMKEGTNEVNEAAKTVNDTALKQWAIFKNQLTVIMLELGEHILPLINQGLKFAIDFVSQLSEKWVVFKRTIDPVIQALKTVLALLNKIAPFKDVAGGVVRGLIPGAGFLLPQSSAVGNLQSSRGNNTVNVNITGSVLDDDMVDTIGTSMLRSLQLSTAAV